MKEKDIIDYINGHAAGKIKLAFADMDGVLRGKYISREKFLSSYDAGLSFCDVVFGWDAADAAYDNSRFTGWHTGYPDCPAKIDLATFRKIPWEDDVPFFLGDFWTADGDPLPVCPRQLLKKVLADAEALGFTPSFSQEFEWFNFEETPQSASGKGYKNLVPLTPGMFGYSILRSSLKQPFFADLFTLLQQFDIPLEGLHTETGPGTYEAAIAHSGILTAADRAVLFKTAVKEIAYKHGAMATFMAKVSQDLPGCGGHIHQSLWQNEKNVFYDKQSSHGISSVMKNYIAGQLHCLPFLLPLLAPTINSYKRLVEGAWAPTTLTWGVDNRTVALRALPGSSKGCRLETRVVGADVNPYLAMAACLAAGLYGIKKSLPLNQPPTAGNGYLEKSFGTLPQTLHEATLRLKESDSAKELLGETFVEHFVQTREWEWRQHLKAVTDWEYKRYFEII